MVIQTRSCRGICKKMGGGRKERGQSPYERSCYCTTCDCFIQRENLMNNPDNKSRLKFCPCCHVKNLRGLHKKRMDNFGVVRISA